MPLVKTMTRPLIPQGEYILQLGAVDEVSVPNTFKRKVNGVVPDNIDKWVWRFYTEDETDEDGNPFEYGEWTTTNYGHPKANLTILLNQLVLGMNKEKAEKFDTDTLVGKKFKAYIRHAQNDKGETVAELGMIRPVEKNDRITHPEPKAQPTTQDEIPF